MTRFKDPRLGVLVFTLLMLVVYYAGYRLYALDREAIHNWITVIHYISYSQIFLIIVLSVFVSFTLSKHALPEKYHLLVVILLAVIVLLPYICRTDPEPDVLVHYTAARFLQERGVVGGLFELGGIKYESSPLIAVIHALFYLLFGKGYIVAETLQRLFYVSLPVFVYLLGRRLWGAEVGFHAALLSLATPNILAQNYFLMQDIPVTVFTVTTVYLMLKTFDDRKYSVLLIISAIAAILTKLNGVIFIFATLPVLLLLKKRTLKGSQHYYRLSVGILGILSIFTVLAVFSIPSMWTAFSSRIVVLSSSYVSRLFSLSSGVPITGLFFQVGFLQIALSLLAIILFYRTRDGNFILLASWLVLPSLALWGTRIRYLMPMFPAISLLAAWGLTLFDGRIKRTVLYSVVLVMVAITLYTTPQMVDDWSFKNLMYAAKYTNNLDITTVGVYTKFAYPWMKELQTVAAVDYYSNKKVLLLGVPEAHRRSNGQGNYVLPDFYKIGNQTSICSEKEFAHYYNSTSTCIDELLSENYSLVYESSGGKYSYHNPYYAKLYVRRGGFGGPTDAILYASNVRFDRNVSYDFWNNIRYVDYPQTYSFGPLKLASSYGVYLDDWLGERQLFIKPPDVGQMNETYSDVYVPEAANLSFSISLRPDTWHPLKGDGVRFRVLVDGDVLLDRYLDPKNNEAERGLFNYSFPLAKYWGGNASFVFQTLSGPSNSSMYDTAGFGDPAVVFS